MNEKIVHQGSCSFDIVVDGTDEMEVIKNKIKFVKELRELINKFEKENPSVLIGGITFTTKINK